MLTFFWYRLTRVFRDKGPLNGCVCTMQSNPIQSNANERAQVFLYIRIFTNLTYKSKHLRFQLTRNENCKQRLDEASVCLDDFLKY